MFFMALMVIPTSSGDDIRARESFTVTSVWDHVEHASVDGSLVVEKVVEVFFPCCSYFGITF